MDFELDDTQRAIQETARAFAREKVAPAAAENDRLRRFPADLIRGLGELGLLAVNVPSAYGGSEAGAVAYALALMEIAAADCATAVTMAVTNMVGELVARFGTEEQKRRHLPRLAAAEVLAGAFALSEPQAGSDAAAMRTRAVRRGDRWVIDGAKQWITSGDVAGVLVVWARTGPADAGGGGGVTAFLVEAGTPGLHVGRHEDKLGIRASSTVALSFDGCEVPDSARLGEVGQGLRVAFAALDGGRVGIASQATGTIRAALEASVRYARDRQAFGVPIAEHQAVAFMLADMAVEHDTARLLALRAAALKEAGRPFTREASMAKLWASEAAQRAVGRAVQIHGGVGYTEDFPVARYFRDARVQTIYEGTSEIQRLVIAREILKEGASRG
ncbi:acyl-CoA dehydrogenase family protein [Anaeromyxobacter dehalogenans]|uniref:Cyclohex-1-ene-1-carbonyl-CoA dehydrogenase n=1 Tax=Anaeromyxobacter dehalogenans (strain 2CP-C) TaxID=290397 RepID=Q2IIG0_ANADE|nr:acyl-CoA dehydrogenase family protein [Anaeromyxobacter dehalogenans]ABC81437.1 Butyryl-CoA dehydrogenase [Anaeromyxobacter dehalogenans 2CP-C]